MPTVVRCGQCKRPVPDPPNTPEDKRRPCEHCGSTSRMFETMNADRITVTDEITGDVTVSPATASASASAPPAKASVTADAERLKVADKTYVLQYLRLSDSGAVMLRVFDEAGYLEGTVQDNPQDAVLAVAERLAVLD